MAKSRLQKHKQVSEIKRVLSEKRSVQSLPENFTISLAHFHPHQEHAASYGEWCESGVLAEAMKTLEGYSRSDLVASIDGDKFTRYGGFPPRDKTKFTHPDHVPEDASWARIHIDGKNILAGHIVRNVFYIVFFDSNHNFFLTERVTNN